MRLRFLRFALLPAAFPAILGAQTRTQARNDQSAAPVRYELAPDGNQARFIVREQLAGAPLPGEAIGSTRAISGAIVLSGKGNAVDPAASQLTVDLTTLQSDQQRRDNYIKRRTLVVDSFPTAVFRVQELRGFPAVLPPSGTIRFTVVGDLTIHGVTRPTLWDATATVTNRTITGKATTRFRFGDFGMQQPRVMVVLSVADDIKLEYDFSFVPAPEG